MKRAHRLKLGDLKASSMMPEIMSRDSNQQSLRFFTLQTVLSAEHSNWFIRS